MRKGDARTLDLNSNAVHFEETNLDCMGDHFTEEEVWNAINQMPCDKAPGPDGFTGIFFKKCWNIIKSDVMRVIQCFDELHVQDFHWLNSANIALLPKKEGAEEITDFRPISLIHAIAKLIAKMLALLLEPFMNDLVSKAQSAFIKKRSIYDNFLYVKNLASWFNKAKIPALLFKLDIRKAFDSVSWAYILDLLQKRGFPTRFRDWVAALFSTATSRVLLNGIAGTPILHGRGLRQGDPLSPLLFVLAIDPISQILEKATHLGLLHKLRGRGVILRTSIYADDAAVFVAPIKSDIANLAAILQNFGEVTGLCTNFGKSSVVPIRCGNLDLEDILEGIPAARASFPLRYLGLPLSVWSLRRRDFQHLEDKCAGRLPTWNGKLINMAGRVELVKSVLSSQAIYHLTPLTVPPGTLNYINKIERAFVWAAKDSTTGAKCKVNWEIVCWPKLFGGLGILHLEKFATTLRFRWPWLEWKANDKIWVGFGNPCNDNDMDIFHAATTITLGNGHKTPFWHAPWLGGRKPKDVAPKIFELCKRKKWTVAQALHHDEWIRKLSTEATISIHHLTQFVHLWSLIRPKRISFPEHFCYCFFSNLCVLNATNTD
jgi:mannosylglycoprotein endo-beta-mannosidase